MREQKFRFIFKDGNFFAKRYMTLDELLDSNFALEQMEESINSESNIYDLEDYPDYEVFKDEYTGFAIKNKEIYEGDIIKISLYDDDWKTKVRDYCGTLIIDVEGCDWNTTALSFLDDEALCEVIGNIYETQSSE